MQQRAQLVGARWHAGRRRDEAPANIDAKELHAKGLEECDEEEAKVGVDALEDKELVREHLNIPATWHR